MPKISLFTFVFFIRWRGGSEVETEWRWAGFPQSVLGVRVFTSCSKIDKGIRFPRKWGLDTISFDCLETSGLFSSNMLSTESSCRKHQKKELLIIQLTSVFRMTESCCFSQRMRSQTFYRNFRLGTWNVWLIINEWTEHKMKSDKRVYIFYIL